MTRQTDVIKFDGFGDLGWRWWSAITPSSTVEWIFYELLNQQCYRLSCMTEDGSPLELMPAFQFFTQKSTETNLNLKVEIIKSISLQIFDRSNSKLF